MKNNKKKIFISIILFVILFGIVNTPLLFCYIPFWDLLVCDLYGNVVALNLIQTIITIIWVNTIAFAGWRLSLCVLDD